MRVTTYNPLTTKCVSYIGPAGPSVDFRASISCKKLTKSQFMLLCEETLCINSFSTLSNKRIRCTAHQTQLTPDEICTALQTYQQNTLLITAVINNRGGHDSCLGMHLRFHHLHTRQVVYILPIHPHII